MCLSLEPESVWRALHHHSQWMSKLQLLNLIDSLNHSWTCLRVQGWSLLFAFIEHFTWWQLRSVWVTSFHHLYFKVRFIVPAGDQQVTVEDHAWTSRGWVIQSLPSVALQELQEEMPDTGGRPNACYLGSSPFFIFYYSFIIHLHSSQPCCCRSIVKSQAVVCTPSQPLGRKKE